jgi:hypothetical protein
MNQHERMYQQIQAHGEKLLKLFPNALQRDAVKLCKQLHTLEMQAHKHAEDCCNGYIEGETEEKKDAALLKRLHVILGKTDIPVFLNGDPRGYSLKIKDEYMRKNDIDLYHDWGGYGILAPDFDGKN